MHNTQQNSARKFLKKNKVTEKNSPSKTHREVKPSKLIISLLSLGADQCGVEIGIGHGMWRSSLGMGFWRLGRIWVATVVARSAWLWVIFLWLVKFWRRSEPNPWLATSTNDHRQPPTPHDHTRPTSIWSLVFFFPSSLSDEMRGVKALKQYIKGL